MTQFHYNRSGRAWSISTDHDILVLSSFRQVQNIIKLEPSVDRFLVHFVMLDSLPL